MGLLNELIQTVGLNTSFFFQLVMPVVLYFISKKLFFQKYLQNYEKRQKLTKGRLQSHKELEQKTEELKNLYEIKAKEIHHQFQEVFNEIKQKVQEEYIVERSNIEAENKKTINQQKSELNQACKEQDMSVEGNLADLTKLLVEKIKA